eukprot:1556779-Prymnesium_polylepis.1
MRLALQGESDCVLFKPTSGTPALFLSEHLLPIRRELAAEPGLLETLLKLEKSLKSGNATVNWAKMKQLHGMGAKQCPSSGMPVWDPDAMSDAQKEQFETLVATFVDQSKAGQKRKADEM